MANPTWAFVKTEIESVDIDGVKPGTPKPDGSHAPTDLNDNAFSRVDNPNGLIALVQVYVQPREEGHVTLRGMKVVHTHKGKTVINRYIPSVEVDAQLNIRLFIKTDYIQQFVLH